MTLGLEGAEAMTDNAVHDDSGPAPVCRPLPLDLAPPGRTLAESGDFAAAAERLGWRGAWAAETNGLDAATACASLAARLSAGRVGTGIVPVQTRNPLLLAMTAAALDQAAPGGFVLGLGVSTPLIIEDWHATPWGASPLELTRECVALVRRFLAGERVTTDPEVPGRWRYRRAQLARPPERSLPIYLAALNDRMLELAGEIADGAILNFVSPADVAHARDRIAAGAARGRRSAESLKRFELMVFFRATATDTFARVEARYRRELLTYVMAPVYQRMFGRSGFGAACAEVERLWRGREREAALAAIPESLVRDRVLAGPKEALAERLDEYAAAGANSALILPLSAADANGYLADCQRTVQQLSG